MPTVKLVKGTVVKFSGMPFELLADVEAFTATGKDTLIEILAREKPSQDDLDEALGGDESTDGTMLTCPECGKEHDGSGAWGICCPDCQHKVAMHINVRVSGPGGCLWAEMAVIKQAIEAAGGKVEVDDDHPAGREITADMIREHYQNWTVKLVADHQPWGG